MQLWQFTELRDGTALLLESLIHPQLSVRCIMPIGMLHCILILHSHNLLLTLSYIRKRRSALQVYLLRDEGGDSSLRVVNLIQPCRVTGFELLLASSHYRLEVPH